MRVKLTRGAEMRTLKQQEFVDAIRASAERAGLPLQRGKGPRAKPRVGVGPPLPEGYDSECEYLDFGLAAPITGAEFGRRLAAELPPGVRLLWQRRMLPRTPHLRAATRSVCYRVKGRFDHAQAAAFMCAPAFPYVRRRKEREEVRDLRHSVARLDVRQTELDIEIRMLPDGTPKVEEVLESVFGIPGQEARKLPTVRTAVRLVQDALPGRVDME